MPPQFLVDQLAHLAPFPILGRPGQQLVGMERVETDNEAPADQWRIEPHRSGRRGIDQEQNEIDHDVGGQVAVKNAQGARPAPGPFLQLGSARGFANAHARMELSGLALLTAYRHGNNRVSQIKSSGSYLRATVEPSHNIVNFTQI